MDEIFISCSQSKKDQEMLDELRKHLSLLVRQRLIQIWDNSLLVPGTPFENEVNLRLNSAQIILLLISPDYIKSDNCYELLERAMERYAADATPVFAIFIRSALWNDAQFRDLVILPTNRRPIANWRPRDDGFLNVAMVIDELIRVRDIAAKRQRAKNDSSAHATPIVVDSEPASPIPASQNDQTGLESIKLPIPSLEASPPSDGSTSKEELIVRGNAAYIAGQYSRALTCYELALQIDPTDATLHYYKGHTLMQLKRLRYAITAYEEALRFFPRDNAVLQSKRRATTRLRVRMGTFAATFLLILLVISGLLFNISNYLRQPRLASSYATATAQARSGSATPASNPTPTVTVHSTPSTSYPPANARLDFSDPLNKPTNGWPAASGCQFASGAYLISSSKSSNSCFYQKAYTDFVYEIQMKFTKAASQGESCGGIIFRYGNPNPVMVGAFSDYSYTICTDDTCQARLEGTTIPLGQNLYYSNPCKGLDTTPGHTNTIAVVAQGSNFTIFINREQIAVFNDASASTGSIGVTAVSSTGEVEIAFTNAKVWTL